MQMKSDRYTNRIRNTDGSLEYLPPGTTFAVSDEKRARKKIAAGRAELVTDEGEDRDAGRVNSGDPSPPAVSRSEPGSASSVSPITGDPSPPGGGDPGDPNPELDKLQEALLNVDLQNPENVLQDGRPKVEVLSEAMGRQVSAVERDEAWEALQEVQE